MYESATIPPAGPDEEKAYPCFHAARKAMEGPCERPDTRIIPGACLGKAACSSRDSNGNVQSCKTCSDKSGSGDWCADDHWGCCYWKGPNPANFLECCAGIKNTFQECGNQFCTKSTQCKVALNDYCGKPENAGKEVCKRYCSKEENKAVCDGPVRAFCADPANRGKGMCACMKAVDGNHLLAPSCFEKTCATTREAYKSSTQLEDAGDCPAFCEAASRCRQSGEDAPCNVHYDPSLLKEHCCSEQHPEFCDLVPEETPTRWEALVKFWWEDNMPATVTFLSALFMLLLALAWINLRRW